LFLGGGGALTHPLISNQTIKFAIVAKHMLPEHSSYADQSGENFETFFENLALNPYPYSNDPYAGGENSVVFYSCEIWKKQPSPNAETKISGNVFLHGLFFAHSNEVPGESLVSGIGSDEAMYQNPVNVDVKKWKRNPNKEV